MVLSTCSVQVAALAPLALLLVLEARCTLSLRTSLILSVVELCIHHCSHTAHIYDDKLVTCYKDVSEHYRDCNGIVPMSKVEGNWIWLYCYQVTYIPIMIIHTCMHITGRFKGYFLSVPMGMANLSATG